MKGIIVYKGKYGATQQYADWISAELGIPAEKTNKVAAKDLLPFDYIIVGGSVYVGKWQAKDWLRSNIGILQHKKTFAFIVCATPKDQTGKIEEIIINNIPASIRNNIYILPGRMIKADLSAFDKFILNMGARMQKDPAERERMLRDFDEVKPENILPLLQSVQSLVTSDNIHSTP